MARKEVIGRPAKEALPSNLASSLAKAVLHARQSSENLVSLVGKMISGLQKLSEESIFIRNFQCPNLMHVQDLHSIPKLKTQNESTFPSPHLESQVHHDRQKAPAQHKTSFFDKPQ
jgi:hypothetical protein